MIPIKLSIQGLYSYQTLQEVDFRQLVDSHVFGIFGKVGSGKSSLLEAISFVLYGKSERLNSGENRAYNMMNLKSGHLIIDFEFRAGADQQLYKFVYEAKRHPKKHHEINSPERRSFQWTENRWVPIGNEKEDISVLAKSILGLDYDNFKRTIIIPQNQFREFLELSPRDRTEMMSRLFRLEKYDLSKPVGKLLDTNKEQLDRLSGQMKGLEGVTAEAAADVRTQLEALAENIKKQEDLIRRFTADEDQLTALQNRFGELAKARQELSRLRLGQERYLQLARDLQQYELVQSVFRPDLEQINRLQGKQTELGKRKIDLVKRLSALIDSFPALEHSYARAQASYENRPQLSKQIDELDTVLLIRTSQESADKQRGRLDQLQRTLNQHQTQLNDQKSQRKNKQALIGDLSGRAFDLSRLYMIRQWFVTYKPLQQQVTAIQERITQLTNQIEDVRTRKDKALVNFPAAWKLLTLKDLPDQVGQRLEELDQLKQRQEATHRHWLVKQQLEQYTQNLTEGAPCPLCGATHHPDIKIHNIVGNEVQQSQRQLKETLDELSLTTGLQRTIDQLLSELRNYWKNGSDQQKQLTTALQALNDHRDEFIWPDFDPEQEQTVLQVISQEEQQRQNLSKTQQALQELNNVIETAENNVAQLEKQVNALNQDVTGLKRVVDSQLATLTYYRADDIRTLTPAQINDQKDQLSRTFADLKQVFDQASRQKNEAEKDQTSLRVEIEQVQEQLDTRQIELTELENRLAAHLAQHQYSRHQVLTLLGSQRDVEADRKRVQDYSDSLTIGLDRVQELESDLNGQTFDEEKLVTLREELTGLNEEYKTLLLELGTRQRIFDDLTLNLARKQQLEQEQDRLHLRQKDLDAMATLFRGQGFVNYVSSVYLHNLCAAANERFAKLTNNNLQLEVDDKNNFVVRDYLNGGQTRLAKTLSGGQMFQASLSLALALSDNIQHLTQSRQNLFFLDEGFGTLDKDSLQTVFKTLQALRNENRIVGIISHVEELQHEVETFIRAEQTETGSRIIRSWE